MTYLKTFLNDESGAVSVDWVVLTAAVVALGILIGNTVRNEIDGVASNLGEDMSSQLGGTYGGGG